MQSFFEPRSHLAVSEWRESGLASVPAYPQNLTLMVVRVSIGLGKAGQSGLD